MDPISGSSSTSKNAQAAQQARDNQKIEERKVQAEDAEKRQEARDTGKTVDVEA